MAISEIKAVFSASVQDVWDIVTSLENYQWRSDLGKIEKLNEKQFVEYTKDGFSTTFTITVSQPYKRWEFDIENSNMKGHWTGIFAEKDGQAEMIFTEDVTAKKVIMKPFVKAFLKKQQTQYVSDLKKALN
ncbi:SRPBCC family protein [uncultured Clostridium sp.]|uniref:SRPBCC family protein n=1 Tax=uncultured Clostridium sp. TaxID=59620 RepID=UPI0025ED3C20|nr:SRPBCC family protein [uncultured Clostridium sp.]